MEFFEDYRDRQEEIVNEAIVLQETRIDDVCGELDEYMSKLENDNTNLGSIEYHDDQVIVFMNDIIDELQDGLVNFSPDINLEGLKIEMELDRNIIQRIDQLLENSTELVPADLVSQDGQNKKVVSYKDLVNNMWNCLNCGAQLHIKHVECPLCKVFRPIETYDNIIHSPESVTIEEIEALKNRRKIEKQMILDLELNSEPGYDEESK